MIFPSYFEKGLNFFIFMNFTAQNNSSFNRFLLKKTWTDILVRLPQKTLGTYPHFILDFCLVSFHRFLTVLIYFMGSIFRSLYECEIPFRPEDIEKHQPSIRKQEPILLLGLRNNFVIMLQSFEYNQILPHINPHHYTLKSIQNHETILPKKFGLTRTLDQNTADVLAYKKQW